VDKPLSAEIPAPVRTTTKRACLSVWTISDGMTEDEKWLLLISLLALLVSFSGKVYQKQGDDAIGKPRRYSGNEQAERSETHPSPKVR
jgi:hypothetical protein